MTSSRPSLSSRVLLTSLTLVSSAMTMLLVLSPAQSVPLDDPLVRLSVALIFALRWPAAVTAAICASASILASLQAKTLAPLIAALMVSTIAAIGLGVVRSLQFLAID